MSDAQNESDARALVDVFKSAQEAQGEIHQALKKCLMEINAANFSRSNVPLVTNVDVRIKMEQHGRRTEFVLLGVNVDLTVQPFAFKRG